MDLFLSLVRKINTELKITPGRNLHPPSSIHSSRTLLAVGMPWLQPSRRLYQRQRPRGPRRPWPMPLRFAALGWKWGTLMPDRCGPPKR
eukprot:3300771-Prymnesium_polylepis.1